MIKPDTYASSAVLIPPDHEQEAQPSSSARPAKKQKLLGNDGLPSSAVLALLSLSKASVDGGREGNTNKKATIRPRAARSSSSSSSFAISVQINGQAPSFVQARKVQQEARRRLRQQEERRSSDCEANHVSDDDDSVFGPSIVQSSSVPTSAVVTTSRKNKRRLPLLSKPRFPSTSEQSRMLKCSSIEVVPTAPKSSSIVYPTAVVSSSRNDILKNLDKNIMEMPRLPPLPVGKPLGLPPMLPRIPFGQTFGGSSFLSTELSKR